MVFLVREDCFLAHLTFANAPIRNYLDKNGHFFVKYTEFVS